MAERAKFQSFDAEVIHRSQIKNAPYNPRVMDKESAKRLRASLSQHGLVEPPVWNRRTGNIVGGHQRMKQLDALEGTKDYTLTVAVVDMDEREEAQLNVQLNNQSLMGDWDMDKLAGIAQDFSIDFEEMGFSSTDVDMLFDGDARFSELIADDEAQGIESDMAEIKAARRRIREDNKETNNINYFVTIVFPSDAEKVEFLQNISVNKWEQCITMEQLGRWFELRRSEMMDSPVPAAVGGETVEQ